jgi:hypothetical protein
VGFSFFLQVLYFFLVNKPTFYKGFYLQCYSSIRKASNPSQCILVSTDTIFPFNRLAFCLCYLSCLIVSSFLRFLLQNLYLTGALFAAFLFVCGGTVGNVRLTTTSIPHCTGWGKFFESYDPDQV